MTPWIRSLLLLTALALLPGCPDQFSTTPLNPDDDDDNDDSADDDDVGDDDTGVSVAEVQAAVDNLTSWPTLGGCSQVTVFGANGSETVELKFTANVDLGAESMPFTEDYDLPGPGASLSLRSGASMGTAICTGSPGTPQVQDNYSVETGEIHLVLDRAGGEPVSQTDAIVTFSGVEFTRVGGSETVTLPNVSLPAVTVGWEP
ncbi:MAG: hypothetical protein QGH45_00690 [Myxococcota bacterium]|jgi:hypothetical protein|nr:hypothetical protein [Myxococcota bacterium]